MTALLDTHAFLWAAFEPRKLSARARELIEDPANDIAVSSISLWEVSLKYSLGKLQLDGCTPDDLPDAAGAMGVAVIAPTAREFSAFHKLPRLAHRDPFDRMMVWQCLSNDWTLVTRDSAAPEYEKLGLRTLW